MLRRINCLPVLLLAGLLTVLAVGCSQDEDIVSPVSTTEITLNAMRLPTPPTGMMYELWLAKPGDTVSLGKFSWIESQQKFLNPDGSERENVFTFNGDIFKYRTMLVTVERLAGDEVEHTGPIMLIDDVTDPANLDFRLVFPKSDSLWTSFVRFNMETPSDGNRATNDGYGIWFSRYQTILYTVPDTFALKLDTVDTIIDKDEPIKVIIGVEDIQPETVMVQRDTSWTKIPGQIWLGADSLKHYGLNFRYVFAYDSTADTAGMYHWEGKALTITTPPTVNDQYVRNRSDIVELFDQDNDDMPDYTSYGWKYKGWLVLPAYNASAMNPKNRITPPVWRYKTNVFNWLPGDDGVLVSTGKFAKIDGPDESNRFKGSGPIPPFPGEDFLNTDSIQKYFGIPSLPLLTLPNGNWGSIFITLEPDNLIDTTTNFPLFVSTVNLPYSAADVSSMDGVRIGMINRTATLDGDRLSPGFPQIDVQIKRY